MKKIKSSLFPSYDKYKTDNKFRMLFSKQEKLNDDQEEIKDLVRYYEQVGYTHTSRIKPKYERLYRLTYGQIDIDDYILEKEIKDLLNIGEVEEIDLKFYPIIPNIVNVFLGEIDKKYIKYLPYAVNSEAKNEILDKMNQELIDVVVKKAQSLFEVSIYGEDVNVQEEKRKAFESSEKIQKYYKSEYRLEVEQWASHVMNIEEEKYNLKQLERRVLEQILVTDLPIIHTSLIGDHYYPEVIEERNCFYLKSPNAIDLSDSVMLGWFNYINAGTILNKYGHILKEEDVKKLETWNYKLGKGFVNNNYKKFIDGNKQDLQESYQNWLSFKDMSAHYGNHRYEEPYQTLIKETFIYFLLPRKEGLLTVKTENESFSLIVDESFKTTIKPIYQKGKPKTKDYLEYGEHVDWGWKNELWKAIKLDINYTNSYTNTSETDDTSSIWVYLGPNEIQYRAKNFRYGVRIPVNGGPSTNKFNESSSIVSKLATWQVDFNFIWNKIRQLLSTEIGKFILLNQSIIPQESLDGTWGKNNFIKALEVARDASLMPVDPSLQNTGQAGAAAQGFGQVVDLTKSQEILEKIQVAQAIKNEAYEMIGVTPQMLGDISPYQSTNTVLQGLQRSLTQVQYIFSRHADVMKAVRETMLETALYLTSKEQLVELNYINSDQQRELFRANTNGWLLYDLGIYIRNNIADTDVVEKLKQLAIQNNTSGADVSDLGAIIGSDSKIEILNKLKDLKAERDKKEQEQREHEEKLQQQQLASNEKMQKELLDREDKNKELDRRAEEKQAMLKALGYANDNAEAISKQMLELKNTLETERTNNENMSLQKQLQSFKEKQHSDEFSLKNKQEDRQQLLEMEALKIRQQEADNRKLDVLAKLKNNKPNNSNSSNNSNKKK